MTNNVGDTQVQNGEFCVWDGESWLKINEEHVTISLSRYEELMKAEELLMSLSNEIGDNQ